MIWTTLNTVFPQGRINFVNHIHKTFEVNNLEECTRPIGKITQEKKYEGTTNFVVNKDNIDFCVIIKKDSEMGGYSATGSFKIK